MSLADFLKTPEQVAAEAALALRGHQEEHDLVEEVVAETASRVRPYFDEPQPGEKLPPVHNPEMASDWYHAARHQDPAASRRFIDALDRAREAFPPWGPQAIARQLSDIKMRYTGYFTVGSAESEQPS